MFSTREVLKAMREANLDKMVTEDTIRNALRRGEIPTPSIFAGRYAWKPAEILHLAHQLDLKVPTLRGEDHVDGVIDAGMPLSPESNRI